MISYILLGRGELYNYSVCLSAESYWNMHISCLLFASNGSPMYKSLTKTKQKYSELEAHETLKRVASANAIIKPYKSSSLITVKRHAMILNFFKS